MVEYGPVVIGEKTYICPIRSVSISRLRGLDILKEWSQTFGVYGRYKTMLNDMTFGNITYSVLSRGYCRDIHLLRGEIRSIFAQPPKRRGTDSAANLS
jgi:hypothetical protein